MSHLQPNCCLKIDFQKVDQHAGGKRLAAVTHVKYIQAWTKWRAGIS